MISSSSSSAVADKEPFIWIRCGGGGKHGKHAGRWVMRTGIEKHCNIKRQRTINESSKTIHLDTRLSEFRGRTVRQRRETKELFPSFPPQRSNYKNADEFKSLSVTGGHGRGNRERSSWCKVQQEGCENPAERDRIRESEKKETNQI